jgi:hypothetical protein
MLYVENILLRLFYVCIVLPKAGEEEAGPPSMPPPFDDIFLSLFSSAFKHHTRFCIRLQPFACILFGFGFWLETLLSCNLL